MWKIKTIIIIIEHVDEVVAALLDVCHLASWVNYSTHLPLVGLVLHVIPRTVRARCGIWHNKNSSITIWNTMRPDPQAPAVRTRTPYSQQRQRASLPVRAASVLACLYLRSPSRLELSAPAFAPHAPPSRRRRLPRPRLRHHQRQPHAPSTASVVPLAEREQHPEERGCALCCPPAPGSRVLHHMSTQPG